MADITCSLEALPGVIEQLAEKNIHKLDECNKEALKQAFGKACEKASVKVKNNFREQIDAFYGAYAPSVYDRANDMYNVLKTSASEEELLIEWDTGAMRQFERGGSITLADWTVGLGYHGGASGTDHNGITEGYPHYRCPVGKWWHWGKAAAFSESPYENFVDWLSEYWEGGEFSEDFLSEYHPILLSLASAALGA